MPDQEAPRGERWELVTRMEVFHLEEEKLLLLSLCATYLDHYLPCLRDRGAENTNAERLSAALWLESVGFSCCLSLSAARSLSIYRGIDLTYLVSTMSHDE